MNSSDDDHALLRGITGIVGEASRIALDFFRIGEPTRASVQSKAGGSPVTEADHAVDAFLNSRLLSLLPQAGWLSEETADTDARLSRDLVFIVDPIDGTRAFMRGDPRWGVSVALVQEGRPVLGVLAMPARAELFCARAGGGAFCNDAPIHASRRSEIMGARVAGPRSTLDAMQAQGLQFEVEPRIPSLAYRLVRVAEGSLDVAIASTNACDWDIAAADLIIHEAGGRLVDAGGQPPRYNRASSRHAILGAWPEPLHPAMQIVLARASAATP